MSPSASPLARVERHLTDRLWRADLRKSGPLARMALRTLRVAILTAHGFYVRESLFRASALTYVTVLSLVPALAFGFSLAKGFGAYETLRHDTIVPFLDRTFGSANEGAKGLLELRQAIDKVLDFVDRTNVSNLGLLGLITLIYMVVKLLSSVEASFNDIWEVKRSRSLARRVADYLAIATIAPVLLVTATGLTAATQTNQVVTFLRETLHLGPLIQLSLELTPLFAVWLGFTFLYLVMPNTTVRIRSALLGGIVGGTLWQLAQVLHVKFQIGVAAYNAIYAGFAVIPVFLVWMYVSWVTVLFGAQIAAAHQHEPRSLGWSRSVRVEAAVRERLALRAMARIAHAFLAGKPPLSVLDLADDMHVPDALLADALIRLADHHVITRGGGDGAMTFTPARDLDVITIKTVLDAIRTPAHGIAQAIDPALDAPIDRALAGLDEALAHSPHNLTFRQIGMTNLPVQS